MKNLAGNRDCNSCIERELLEAGIKVIPETPDFEYEVAWKLTGALHGWRFVRAWRYWMASTKHNPLPMEAAMSLHTKHGQEVRVDGHCGCPSPDEWWKRWPDQTANHYHVDTQEGLNALAAIIRAGVSDVKV